MCVHFDALKALLLDSKGFEFVEEGARKKKGFVGLKPGEDRVWISVGKWASGHNVVLLGQNTMRGYK